MCMAKQLEGFVENLYLTIDQTHACANRSAGGLRACLAGRFGFVGCVCWKN